ncbi:781_t:CDS:2, partial [Cetraspora pellucida]
MSEIQSDTENQNDILSYFPLDKATGKAKCKLCPKKFTHPINELIARNHFAKSHKEEWDALEKDNDNKSTKSKTSKSVKDKPVKNKNKPLDSDDENYEENDKKFNLRMKQHKSKKNRTNRVKVNWDDDNINFKYVAEKVDILLADGNELRA